jgi:hypothetical protein
MSIIALAASGFSRRRSSSATVLRSSGAAPDVQLDLRETPFADFVVSGVIGGGRRCVAFAVRGRGRDLVLKAYHAGAATRHARRCGVSIARYEFERNAAFRSVAQLTTHVAAPVAFLSSPGAELFLQERVFGTPLTTFLHDCSAECRRALLARLLTILTSAHEARLFDLDLHPSNVLVRRTPDGTAWPMLFDFNKVPFHIQPPNALVGLLVKLGVIGRRARDYRQWKRLQRA